MVVLRNPVRYTLRKRHVVQGRGELAGVAIDLHELVDVACVVDLADAQKAHVVRRELRVLQPRSPQEVAAADAEGAEIHGRLRGGALNLDGEFGRGSLIRIENEDPRMT